MFIIRRVRKVENKCTHRIPFVGICVLFYNSSINCLQTENAGFDFAAFLDNPMYGTYLGDLDTQCAWSYGDEAVVACSVS